MGVSGLWVEHNAPWQSLAGSVGTVSRKKPLGLSYSMARSTVGVLYCFKHIGILCQQNTPNAHPANTDIPLPTLT